ncbi:hypothetical protein [Shewanella atlantica]|uniref:Condensation protein n=1 Tax=Shewanella atlantica TaxID=271099 RepID=A0A431W924_9GAMM|nr:hypothetical protein [Shewanella atlantica]RTR32004.1 hypothetical protein EKG39_11255 [Shewanella atlantica]
MNKDEHAKPDGRETLQLTQWELENLHLPPVTTVTLFEGAPPVEYLRQRLAMMLEKNPWLTSRIVKKSTENKVVALAYSTSVEPEASIDQHLTVHAPGDTNFSLSMPYEALVNTLLPVQCARSKPATDKDEALFKVAVIPVKVEAIDSDSSAPLQQAMTEAGFALVISMNHTLGDGHTYYKLYDMLSADTDIEALDPVRVDGFEAAKIQVVGEQESAMFRSPAVAMGIMGDYLGAKITRRPPQNVAIHHIEPEWLSRQKAKAKQEHVAPFVSSNDIISSWFFREMRADLNIMLANFRSRQPSIAGLNEQHAGNYEANVPYFKGDIENPALIRQSIHNPDGTFRARRAGTPATEIPEFMTLLHNKSALITNWATFYRDLVLPGKAEEREDSEEPRTQNPKLHFPIMESNGIITSVWNNGIIFRPRAGELGILMISNHFDSEGLNGVSIKKAQDDPNSPIGERIV